MQVLERDGTRIWTRFLVSELQTAVKLNLTCISKRLFPVVDVETSISKMIHVLGLLVAFILFQIETYI